MSGATADPRVAEHLAAFQRGAIDLIEAGELQERLARALGAGEGLRVKFGMDPNSPDVHVGHMVQLRKLRDLQDLGHTVVLIVGDATAMIGDPSGKNKLRPQLSREEVQANLTTYRDQAALVLDMDRCEVRQNSEWFDGMGFEEFVRLCGRMTVARMLERDTFQERVAAQQPIGIHEFLYPLMQGWDSVMIDCDVELGGTDQLFNLHVGRMMQEQEGRPPQCLMTQPLIEGSDGRKMSKSYGNAIGLTEPAEDVFGKVMSIPDEPMRTWFTYLTRVPLDEIGELLDGHPKGAKLRLAQEITAFLHGEDGARRGRAAFERGSAGEAPEEIPSIPWPGEVDEDLPLFLLLQRASFAASSSEARRLVQQGGVRVDGETVSEPGVRYQPAGADLLIQAGKRRFVRITRGS